jgi:hypothetical protein
MKIIYLGNFGVIDDVPIVSSPDPRDEAGLVDDGNLEGCRFESDNGFSGEEAGGFLGSLRQRTRSRHPK